jgi:protein CpxP
MKNVRLLIAVLALSLVPLSFAQDTQAPADQQHEGRHGHGGMRGMGDPDQHLQMLTKQLNLTKDQQDKIRPILQEQHDKMQQQMQSNANASQDDRRAAMKQSHEETVSRINEVLTPDQQKKFATMQKNMMEHRHGGRDHGDHDHGDNSPKS